MALRKYELFVATMAHIKTFKSHWDQESYNCKTGMCAAGWASVLGGGKFKSQESDVLATVPADVTRALENEAYVDPKNPEAETVARVMLGLDESSVYDNGYVGDLFSGSNTYATLIKFGALLYRKSQKQLRADIDAYIKKHKLKDPFENRVARKKKAA